MIVSILSKWKCRVTTALNGLSGFEERISHKSKSSAFDLILCDLHMPMCDGYKCVEMIREWEIKNNKEPALICALTADANPDTRDRCLSEEGGFDEFLAKPLRKNALRDTIVELCGQDRLFLEDVPKPRSRNSSFAMAHTGLHSDSTANGKPFFPSSLGTHILVVDDAPTMRLLMRMLLTGMGCTVSEASSGESAVEIVRASLATGGEPIELIFCDIRMPPGINGIETARRITQICTGNSMSSSSASLASPIPIIGMTADEVDSATLNQARSAGMVSMVSKPLGKADIASFLADYAGTVLVPNAHPRENKVLASSSMDKIPIFEEDKAMETCGQDKAFLDTLLKDMARDLQARKDSLARSVQRKDTARVAEISHNIKGMAALCSFPRLQRAACDCQQSASNNSEADFRELRSRSQVVQEEISRAIKIAGSFDPSEEQI